MGSSQSVNSTDTNDEVDDDSPEDGLRFGGPVDDVVRISTSLELGFSLAEAFADLHKSRIPGGTLSSLSNECLEAVYEGLISAPEVFFAYSVTDQAAVTGYIMAATSLRRAYLHTIRGFGAGAFLKCLLQTLGRGTSLRLVESLRYPFSRRTLDGVEHGAQILNFAVDHKEEGAGTAQRLYDALCSQLTDRGIGSLVAVTGQRQSRAKAFYARNGGRLIGNEVVHADNPQLVYYMRLS